MQGCDPQHENRKDTAQNQPQGEITSDKDNKNDINKMIQGLAEKPDQAFKKQQAGQKELETFPAGLNMPSPGIPVQSRRQGSE